jgi:hypothetical protein
VPAEPGSHYTAAPIAIVVVLCLLALALRWVFGTGRSRRRSPSPPPRPGVRTDYGLLRPVALLPGRPEGNALRATLTEAGIRSTLSARPDGQVELLVFAADLVRARSLLPPP